MQVKRVLLLGACVLALAALSMADSLNDPKIIVGGNSGLSAASDDGGPIPIFGNSFSFISPSGTSPSSSPCIVGTQQDIDCLFINENDNEQTWTTLTFDIKPFQTGLTCDHGFFFAQCTVNPDLGTITFSGGPGLAFGDEFQMIVEGFLPGSGFAGAANVPEPATLVLLLTAAGAVIRRRRS